MVYENCTELALLALFDQDCDPEYLLTGLVSPCMAKPCYGYVLYFNEG